MPVMNFDLEDGLRPISFDLKAQDCERFMEFLAECQAIKEVLAEPQQGPVAWWNKAKDTVSTDPVHRHNPDCQPLYAAPQQRKPWVGLTVEEVDELQSGLSASHADVRAIEAKLKEKNT